MVRAPPIHKDGVARVAPVAGTPAGQNLGGPQALVLLAFPCLAESGAIAAVVHEVDLSGSVHSHPPSRMLVIWLNSR